MMGLCGWLGGDCGGAPSEEVLVDMLAALNPLHPGTSTHGSAASGAAVGALKNDNFLWVDGSVLCAFDGLPGWADPVLEKMAATSGNAKAFTEGFRLYGETVFDRLSGAFSVAMIDREKKEAIIAIDRMGIHGLTYATGAKGLFVFGSTTDSVRRHPGITSTVSAQAVYNYLFNYVVPSPGTIYEEQSKLLPGQLVCFKSGRVEKRFYWEMPYTIARARNLESWKERLWKVLDKSFDNCMGDLDPADIGAFLSGGLDSSTVAGLLAKQVEKAKTFTIGFREPQYDESGYARIVAERFSTEHHEYFVTPQDVVDLAPRIAAIYDEPYGNTSAVPAFYCAKAARDQGVKTMLAGDGGDEIFAGNERYVYMKRIESYGRIPYWLRAGVLEPLTSLPGLGICPPVRKAQRLAERYATPMPERIYSHNYFADGRPEDILEKDFLSGVDLEGPMKLIQEAYNRPKSASMLQRMMHLDLKITLADNDLRKVNKMCHLAGIDVRYPFLEEDLVEFAASIPSDMLLPGLKLRDFFKKAMKGFLPQEILTKEKHGFGLPFNVWIKTDKALQALVLDQLTMFRKRKYLRPGFIDRVISGCRTPETVPTDSMAWDIAMLEMWLEKHTDGKM